MDHRLSWKKPSLTCCFHTIDDDFSALCRPVNNRNGERFNLTDERDLLANYCPFQLVRNPQDRSNCCENKKRKLVSDNHLNREKKQ